MTKPFRIALKVWLCVVVVSMALFFNILILANDDSNIVQISGIILLDIVYIGGIGLIIFWEKLTR